MDSLSEEGARRSSAETDRLLRMLRGIRARIDEIVRMSHVCGARKRSESYAINERINTSLQVWHCENASGAHCLGRRLQALESRVKERTDTAVEVVHTCRGCVSPVALTLCLESSSRDSRRMLLRAEEWTRREVESAEELKDRILREDGAVLTKLMERFEAELTDFAMSLDECVAELRKAREHR